MIKQTDLFGGETITGTTITGQLRQVFDNEHPANARELLFKTAEMKFGEYSRGIIEWALSAERDARRFYEKG